MKKLNVCSKVLKELYVTQKMSFKEVARFLQKEGTDIKWWTISRRLKELGITRTVSQALLVKKSNKPSLPLLEKELEALDGFLLGDGHIEQKSARSSRLSFTVQYEEFGKYLLSHFARYNPNGRQRYIHSKRYKKILSQWSGETKSDKCFLDQKKRWYPQGTKIVPKDVRLTPLSLLLWYLGDGFYAFKKGYIFLNTQGFVSGDVDFLCSKLNKLGIDCHRDKRNKIYIGTHYAQPFLNLLSPNSVACYNYKFEGMDDKCRT